MTNPSALTERAGRHGRILGSDPVSSCQPDTLATDTPIFWRKCAQKRQPFKNCALGAELRCRGFRFVQLLLRAWTAQIAWSWDVGLFRDVDLPYDVLGAIFHWS